MLRTLRDEDHRGSVTFLHYARTAEDAIFGAELAEIAAECEFADVVSVHTRAGGGSLTGRFDVGHLRAVAPDYAEIPTFVCGPSGLVDRVQQVYEDAGAAERLHVEYFKTPPIAADPSAWVFVVEILLFQYVPGVARYAPGAAGTAMTGDTVGDSSVNLLAAPVGGAVLAAYAAALVVAGALVTSRRDVV